MGLLQSHSLELAVSQSGPASAPATESARERSRCISGERFSMRWAGSGLWSQHQAASDLCSGGTCCQHARDSLAVANPAGSDKRQVGRFAHELKQSEKPDGCVVRVVERALVTPRF